MKDKVKDIIDRLDRIDNKSYTCSFEFADSGSFEEDCRCFDERNILKDYIIYLENKENKILDYIKDKIMKSFKADYGLEGGKSSDRLFTETVIELQLIEKMLKDEPEINRIDNIEGDNSE